MLKKCLKIGLRNSLRHKAYSFINIAGLAVGITCCLLILLFAQDELSYDRYHKNADRIYRLVVENEVEGRVFRNALSSAPMVPALLRDYPEIESAARLYPSGAGVQQDIPNNSHLRFDFLASFQSLDPILGEALQSWTYNPFFSYLLRENYAARELDNKIASPFEQKIGEQLRSLGWHLRPFLQPLTDNHLHPLGNELDAQGDIRYVYIFYAIKPLEVFKSRRATGWHGFFSRKTLEEATASAIVLLLSRGFITLVLIANLVAWPVAYFAMNKWLLSFAYRADLGRWFFVFASGLALLVALLTVSTQAIKAALANPVDALRYE